MTNITTNIILMLSVNICQNSPDDALVSDRSYLNSANTYCTWSCKRVSNPNLSSIWQCLSSASWRRRFSHSYLGRHASRAARYRTAIQCLYAAENISAHGAVDNRHGLFRSFISRCTECLTVKHRLQFTLQCPLFVTADRLTGRTSASIQRCFTIPKGSLSSNF